MMNIEEKIKEAINSYESKNSAGIKDFEAAQSLFDDLVRTGLVEKRGNHLADTTQRTNIHVKFNCN